MLFPDTPSAAGSNPVKAIKKGHHADVLFLLVGATGFEPAAF
jgi:hypothetical protein